MIEKQDIQALDYIAAALKLELRRPKRGDPQTVLDKLNALFSAHTCCGGDDSPIAAELEALAILAADQVVSPDRQRLAEMADRVERLRAEL